jgi:MurNAc alpha-1-phosphate uridylyltransferase
MVLAAGLGTRLKPFTDERPKALVEVAGKPLIDHALDRLAAVGVEWAVVNVHAFADLLEAHLARRKHPAVAISDERDVVLETGGGLKKAIPLLGESPVWISNIDTVALGGDDGLAALAAAWRPYAMDVLLLLAPTATSLGFHDSGDVFLEPDGRVRFKDPGETAPYLYVGLHIARPEIVANGPQGAFGLLDVWKALAAKGRVFGLSPPGLWMHVSDPAGKALVEARLSA